MATTTLRFKQDETTVKGKNSTYQEVSYKMGTILYTDRPNLPSRLSTNALIFTTDTHELFVGTGSGVTRLKLGTEEDINPKIYLKLIDAAKTYETKVAASEMDDNLRALVEELRNSVYSKADIDEFLTKDVDLDGVLDRVNTYTLDKINELLEEKARTTDVYTREQADEIYATKAEKDAYETTAATVSDHETRLTAVEETYENKTDHQADMTALDEKITNVNNKVDYLGEITYTKEQVDGFITDTKETAHAELETAQQELQTAINNNSTEILNVKNTTYTKTEIDEKVTTLQ